MGSMRRTAAVLAASLSLALSACAGAGAGAPSASGGGGSAGVPSGSAVATQGATSASPSPTPTMTPGVYATKLIATEVLKSADAKRPALLSIPSLPDSSDLNAAMHAWADGRVKAFEAGSGDELAGDWMLELQQWPLVGVRLQAITYTKGVPLTVTKTFYTDAAAHSVWPGDQLFASPKDAATAVRAALAAKKASAPGVPDADLIADVRFNGAGGLTVLVPGRTAKAGGGVTEVTIPAAKASPLLAEAGQKVRDAYAAHWKAAKGTAPVQTNADVDCEKTKCIALTFDDGPGAYGDLLVDVLEATGVKTTFFEIGKNVRTRPLVDARARALGHEIDNHTYDHVYLDSLPLAQQKEQIDRAAAMIESASGTAPLMVRPPYGHINPDTVKLGVPLALWNIDSNDWEDQDAAKAIENTRGMTRRGNVVLFHSIYPSTVDAIPTIIEKLKGAGYTFVTMDTLYSHKLTPGSVYFSQHDIKPGWSSKGSAVVTVMPSVVPSGDAVAGGGVPAPAAPAGTPAPSPTPSR